MQRQGLLTVLLVAIAVVVAAAWNFAGSPVAPPPVELPPPAANEEGQPARATDGDARVAPEDASSRRAAAAPLEASVQDDPEIRAAMAGFKGRIVSSKGEPQPGCGVRIYRGSVDSLLRPGMDLFAAEPTMAPDYVVGEVQTDDEGRFVIGGVWPRGICVLFAGIGTDAPTHQALNQTPGPGEIVDLGDIRLIDAAVAVGVVVDEDGAPVADADVMAVDLPGSMLDFVPVERFDPDGGVLIREKNSPVQVLELPAWVAEAYGRLPIPKTRSAADGSFRLVGITPGMNVVAAVRRGLAPAMQKSVKFEAGQTRDLGELRLREGEEVTVRVVDEAGKPVAAAEVLAGTTSAVVPFDFGNRMGSTDQDGYVTGLGFGRGKVTAAARRSPQDPWVLAEPQSPTGDVVITLPTLGVVQVRVTMAGQLVAKPQLRLIQGSEIGPATVMSMMGLNAPVPLPTRTHEGEEGWIEIRDLPLGAYTIFAKAEGSATAATGFEAKVEGAKIEIELRPSRNFLVKVIGPNGEPIRNAAIWVQESGESRRREGIPLCPGRTDAKGELRVHELVGDEGRVSAEHPKWGMTHGKFTTANGEVVLQMQQPGWIEGFLLDGGKAPPLGKHGIAVMERRDWGNRTQAVDFPPMLAAVKPDGAFAVTALQPGNYSVNTIPAFDAMRSPGSIMSLQQAMWGVDLPDSDVTVTAGAVTTVQMDLAGERYDGPVGSVFGSAQIDGAPAVGARVMAWTKAGRRMAEVDAAGRFELRDLPAGNVTLSLSALDDSRQNMFSRSGIWSERFDLAEAETKDLVIDIRTSSLSGLVLKPDGTPMASAFVTIRSEGSGKAGSQNGRTDADGRFSFAKVQEGVYTLSLQRWTENAQDYRGELSGLRLDAGRPLSDVTLRLEAAVKVSGRVDLSAMTARPKWMWLVFSPADPAAPGDRNRSVGESHAVNVDEDGSFSTSELSVGAWWASLHLSGDNINQNMRIADPIVVPSGGLANVLLLPVPDPDERRK